MNKTTGIIIFLSFLFLSFFLLLIVVGILVFALQGTKPTFLAADRLALVRIDGMIITGESWIKEIEQYSEDRSIRGIVLEIDSGGGAVVGSQHLHDAIKRAREEHGKKVVAYFKSIAASGAYYAACAADSIVASPGSMTGSIGVYMSLPEAEKLLERIGVDFQTIKAGQYKNIGSIARSLSREEEELLQHMVDDIYDQFIEAVRDGRQERLKKILQEWTLEEHGDTFPFSPDVLDIIDEFQNQRDRHQRRTQAVFPRLVERDETEVNQAGDAETTQEPESESEQDGGDDAGAVNDVVVEVEDEEAEAEAAIDAFEPDEAFIDSLVRTIADGKIYTGRQAQRIGLVDELGNLDDAIELAARLAGIRGEPTVVERKRRQPTIWDILVEQLPFLQTERLHSPVRYEFPY